MTARKKRVSKDARVRLIASCGSEIREGGRDGRRKRWRRRGKGERERNVRFSSRVNCETIDFAFSSAAIQVSSL